jgi:hypothetical protein
MAIEYARQAVKGNAARAKIGVRPSGPSSIPRERSKQTPFGADSDQSA